MYENIYLHMYDRHITTAVGSKGKALLSVQLSEEDGDILKCKNKTSKKDWKLICKD